MQNLCHKDNEKYYLPKIIRFFSVKKNKFATNIVFGNVF